MNKDIEEASLRQLHQTIDLYLNCCVLDSDAVLEDYRLGDLPYFGVTIRPHRYFSAGDFVLYQYRGDYRTPVWSVTSKGKTLCEYWIQFEKVRKRGVIEDYIHRIWLPGDRGVGPCGVSGCGCPKPESIRHYSLNHPASKKLFASLVLDEALPRK